MSGLVSEMHPADRVDPAWTSWGPWPVGSGTEVVFLPGERSVAEQIARRFFHRPLKTWEYAGLAGAPDDAKVEVGATGRRLYLEMGDPAGGTYRAYYYVRRASEKLVLVNDGFHILFHNMQNRGLGLCMFSRQVTAATVLGVHRIELVAGRRGDENGYYTWPRFGFEGVLFVFDVPGAFCFIPASILTRHRWITSNGTRVNNCTYPFLPLLSCIGTSKFRLENKKPKPSCQDKRNRR